MKIAAHLVPVAREMNPRSYGLAALLLAVLMAACEDEGAIGPPFAVEPPRAGVNGSAVTGSNGQATVSLGSARLEFSVVDASGGPVGGVSVFASAGDDLVLAGVHDPQGNYLPEIGGAVKSLFTGAASQTQLSGTDAPSAGLVIGAAGPGVLGVSVEVSADDIALRALGLSASLVDQIGTDDGLQKECDLELELNDAVIRAAGVGGGLIAFIDRDTELAFAASSSADNVLQALDDELDLFETTLVEACEVVVGNDQASLTLLQAFSTTPFAGIYAHSGRIFTGDPPSDLYFVEAGSAGEDIFLQAIVDLDDGSGLAFVDLAVAPGGTQLLGIANGSELYRLGRDGRAVLDWKLRGFTGINGLAVAPNGRIYGSTASGWLVFVDSLGVEPGVAASVPVGEFGSGLVSAGDLVFAPDGKLYATLAEVPDQSADENFFAEIDIETGAATIISNLNGFEEVWGLVFSRGELYGLTSLPGRLLRIDPTSGVANIVRSLSFDPTGAAGE